MPRPSDSTAPVAPLLGVWDAVSIIVGVVIGATIFRAAPMVFANVSGPWTALGAWALGGLLSLAGALCYAELAGAWPRSGGDYVYLTHAYGRGVGFLFGWAQLSAIQTGSMGMLAYVFADYAIPFWNVHARHAGWFAAAAVMGLTLLNMLGIAFGKTAQNVLSASKVLGLGAIIAVGAIWGGEASLSASQPPAAGGLGLAMILVLLAYGGWSDAAFVASEVRDRRRNVPKALIIGTCFITLIYLLVNAAYLWGLGFEGARAAQTPAADVLQLLGGDWGSKAISVLVILSALGGLNGVILTGSRLHATMGADHRVFAWLGRWHPRWKSPVWSLAAQAGVALAMIVAVGTAGGRAAIDALFRRAGTSPLPWERYGSGFETLVAISAPVFWFFFLLTGLAVFVLRYREPHVERPFRVPLYPFVPAVFCLTSVWMLHASLVWAERLVLLAAVPLLLGGPLYLLSGFLARRRSGL